MTVVKRCQRERETERGGERKRERWMFFYFNVKRYKPKNEEKKYIHVYINTHTRTGLYVQDAVPPNSTRGQINLIPPPAPTPQLNKWHAGIIIDSVYTQWFHELRLLLISFEPSLTIKFPRCSSFQLKDCRRMFVPPSGPCGTPRFGVCARSSVYRLATQTLIISISIIM